MFRTNAPFKRGIKVNTPALIGLYAFCLFCLLFSSVAAQTTGDVVLQESFSGNTFPTGWSTVTSHTNYNWAVVQGVKSIEGDSYSSSMNIQRVAGKEEKNLNIWAFSRAMNLKPGRYTLQFDYNNSAGGTAGLRFILNTMPDYKAGKITEIKSVTLPPRTDWTTFEYEFILTEPTTYYLGIGATSFFDGVNLNIDEPKVTWANKFYNKQGLDVSLLSSWGVNQDGSGFQPVSFADPGQTFFLYNYTSNEQYPVLKSWGINGESSKLVLGTGLAPVTLKVNNNMAYVGNGIDVMDYATLSVDNSTCPSFGYLAPLSTVVFGVNAPTEISEGTVFGTVIFDTAKKSKFTKKVKVTGKLDLKNAKLDLGDNDIELDFGATVVNGSPTNYVVLSSKGRIRKAIRAGAETVNLPVGNTTYNPVKIKLATGSQDDVFSIGLLEGVYGTYTNDVPDLKKTLSEKIVNKTWIVSEDVKGGSDISLTFTWSATDVLTGFDATKCHIKHYENNAWDADMPVAASVSTLLNGLTSLTTYSVTRTGITSFSPFTVSSEAPAVLPVDLLHFEVKATENNLVKLSWATAMEKNNHYFAVEKSQDGKFFTQVATVEGKGTTNNRSDYTFTDNNPLTGTSYYRLRQVDFNGTEKHLPVRAITLKTGLTVALNIYPNPAQGGQVNLQVQGLPASEEVKVLVSDLMGSNVLQKQLRAGLNTTIAPGELKAGTYMVKVVGKAGVQTQKLVVR